LEGFTVSSSWYIKTLRTVFAQIFDRRQCMGTCVSTDVQNRHLCTDSTLKQREIVQVQYVKRHEIGLGENGTVFNNTKD